MKNKLAVFTVFGFLFWANRHSSVFSLGLGETLTALLLLAITVAPTILWLIRGMRGLPILELFCLAHFVYYAYPILATKPEYMDFSEGIRVQAGLAVCAFLICSYVGYFLLRSLKAKPPGRFVSRQIEINRIRVIFWVLLFLWISTTIVVTFGLMPFAGRLLNILRTISASSGIISIFFLFYLQGQRKFSLGETATLNTTFAIGIIVSFASGFLVGGSTYMAMALIGFAFGKKRIPFFGAVLCMSLVSFLHLGKGEMRLRYWEGGMHGDYLQLSQIYPIYRDWVSYSWRNAVSPSPQRERTSVIDRLKLIHMLALVMNDTPSKLPYLKGETYAHIPKLAVPRMLWPEKPRGHISTETLGLYYNVQTEESVLYTSVGFGLIAEAWANFGWLGAMAVGLLFGILTGIPARLSLQLPVNSIGFLASILIVSWTFQLEHALSSYLISLAQSLMVVLVGLFFISSRPPRTQSQPIRPVRRMAPQPRPAS